MKIIRPMELTGGIVESNAPGDGYQPWEPLGRDFLTTIDIVDQSSAGAVCAVITGAGTISLVDLEAGTITDNDSWGSNFLKCKISPDSLYLALLDSGGQVTVRRLSDGATVYAYQGDSSLTLMEWTPDSSKLIHATPIWYYYDDSLYVVDSTTWQSNAVASLFLLANAATPGSSENFYFAGVRLCTEDTSSHVLLSISPRDTFIDSTESTYYDAAILVNLTTGAEVASVYSVSQRPPLTPRFTHNPQRNEFVQYYPSARALDDQTLAANGLAPSIPRCDIAETAPDGSELIFKAQSSQPYWRRFSASNYTALTALDSALPSAAKRITYSDDYYVATLQSGGYALIDRTDDQLITQTNPSVTAGDIYTYGDRNYEALEDNNDRPDLGAQLEVPTWLNLGAINPLRMFDAKLDSRTTAPSPLTITVTPGMITNGLALFNVSAASVQVVMDDPTDGVVYDSGEIQMLDNSAVNNWWDFFFAPYLEKADLALIDLPPYPGATLTITLSSDGGDVALGELVLGRVQNIGEAQYGTSVGIIDSSTKERDVFGNFEIIERKFSKRAEFDVSVPTSSASGMQRILAQYRATPVVWVGNMGLEATIVYGFYRDFQINFSHYSLSDATITVEGL